MNGGINLYAYVGNNPLNRIDPMGLADKLALDIVSITHLPNAQNAPYGYKLQVTYQLTINGAPAVGYKFQEKVIPGLNSVQMDNGEWKYPEMIMAQKDWQGNKIDTTRPWDIGPKPGNGYQVVTNCKGRFVDGPYGAEGMVPFSTSWKQQLYAVNPNNGKILNLGTNNFSMYSFSEGSVRWRLENPLFGTFGEGK